MAGRADGPVFFPIRLGIETLVVKNPGLQRGMRSRAPCRCHTMTADAEIDRAGGGIGEGVNAMGPSAMLEGP